MRAEFAGFINQLRELNAEEKPQWGSMNVQQMIEHLSQVVMISNGKQKVQQTTPPDKLERVKAFLLSDQPLPRNFKAPFITDHQPLRTGSIPEAVAELEEELQIFEKHFIQPDREEVHPVFGPLTHEEWIIFHRKHLEHHLTQFGWMK